MRGITLICVVAVAALALLPFLPTSVAQFCGASRSCPEGRGCVRNGRLGVCSNGTVGQLCGGRDNVPCIEGQCQYNVCQAPPSSTTP